MFLLAQVPAPNNLQLYFTLALILVLCAVMSAFYILMILSFKKVKPGQALIRTGAGGTIVSFDRAVVIPNLHHHELITLTVHKLSYERVGDWALLFKCGTRVELVADLMMRVNKETEDIKRAAQTLGCERLNDTEQLRDHYSSRFNDSLEAVAGSTEFNDFHSNKNDFRNALLKHLGTDLDGMVSEDACIHHFRKI